MFRMMHGSIAAGAWVLAMSWFGSPPARAAETVVVTHAGQTLTGELVSQTPDRVTLRIAGIETPIDRADIKEMTRKKTIEEEYAQRRATVADSDFEGRYNLAYWLFENNAYNLAMTELKPLEQVAPDSDRIKRLMALIESKQQLEQSEAAAGPAPVRPAVKPGEGTTADTRTEGGGQALLTKEQINKIKLWELPANLMEAQPNVSVPSETLDKLFKDYAANPAVPKGKNDQRAFRGKRGYEQLDLIFRIRARDLYDEVIILDDPESLVEYRRNINPNYVARYFRQYFGTGQIPGLMLLAQRPNSVEEAYTNFYLLSTASQNGLPIIDRAAPDQSLLLQWGLPREFAAHPAPEAQGWRPFFSGPDDANFKRYAQWINSLFDRPEYGIQYNPEQAPAPDAPAPTPAGS